MTHPEEDYEEFSNFDYEQDQESFLEDIREELSEEIPQTKRSFPWKWVIGGCVGLPLFLGLICFGLSLLGGLSALSEIQEIAALSQAASATPVATLVPTADLSHLHTPTPTPEPPTPTPTLLPPAGEFIIPLDGLVTDLNQPVGLQIALRDGKGLTAVQIIDNGQTIISERYSGQTEVTFQRNWTPLADGHHRLKVEVTNIDGEKNIVAETAFIVLDPDFLSRNQAIFDRVRTNVIAIRGLDIVGPIYESRMGLIDLRRYFREVGYTVEETFDETQVLALFDLAPRGSNIYEEAIQFSSTNVLGFYDPDTKDLALIGTSRDLNVLDEYTYAHEIMHALQDQHFSLEKLASDDLPFGGEGYLPLRAIAEGEAELLQEIYLDQGYIGENGQVEIFNEISRLPRSNQSAAVVGVAPIVVETSFFPYQTGLEFVRYIYNQGGWEAVNEAWRNTPTSTEQIIHPQRFLNGDVPLAVEVSDVSSILGDPWRLLGEGSLGEFQLRLMLDLWLTDAEVDSAATGWGGDRFNAFIVDETGELVLVWRSAWDSPEDSAQFGQALETYASRAYGDNLSSPVEGATCRNSLDVICIAPIDGDWLLVRAPTQELAAALLQSQLGS